MLKIFLDYRLDFILFAATALTLFGLLDFFVVSKSADKKGILRVTWLILTLLLMSAFVLMEHASASEKSSLQKMLQGLAPTYAIEMARMGHEKISAETPADDPLYLSLIDSEKAWLKANPVVNDIYTFGKNPQGQIVLLVDSETDYDRNGRYEGEREQRTAIGEVYPEADQVLARAFEGHASFDAEPYTDRWGTWVSAYEPLRNAEGQVNAVLGVDYAAGAWLKKVAGARGKTLLFMTILLMGLLFSAGLLAMMRSQMVRQERAADLIRQSEERFRALSDFAPVGIYRADAQGRRVYANSRWQAIAGMTDEQAMGTGWTANLHPDDRQRVVELWERSVKSRGDFSAEFRYVHPSGETHWVESRAVKLRDGAGNILGLIGITQDVTERKKLESQLLQAQKMETVGTLAGGIAHDLNNQLTPLMGYLTLLRTEIEPSNPCHGMVEEAVTASERCAEIVRRLLDFSRPSSLKKTAVDVKSLLEECHRMLVKFLPTTIRIETVVDPDAGAILANSTEVQTVLMNLATNARDAMPQGGLFRIQASRTTSDDRWYVRFRVSDTGCGMPPELIARIFEPFFTTKTKGKGTGLGLAMAFAIVTNHEGKLEVRSRVGEGTTFDILLPCAKEKPAEGKLSAPSPSSQSSSAKKSGTILIVDDEEALRNLAKALIQKIGYKTMTAADGEEALAVHRKHSGDISAVLLDMTMPKMTGRQVLQGLLDIDPKTRVILVSGFTSEGSSEELIKAGAKEFIQKPYAVETLTEALHRVLKQ